MWDVRCHGPFKRPGMGGICNQLLCRVTCDTHGTLEVKCPRCRTVQRLRIGASVATATT